MASLCLSLLNLILFWIFLYDVFKYSIQSAYEAIQQQGNSSNNFNGRNSPFNNTSISNRQRNRRNSLPADSSLSGALKRTASHKRFPHLNPTRSIPFGFSPIATTSETHHSLLPCLRPSKSHCNLPHLPCTPVTRSSRRGSLPANFKMKNQM